MSVAAGNGQIPIPPPCEIVFVPNAAVGAIKAPDNPQALVLVFSLPNGRQYQFQLDAGGRKAVMSAVSGLQVFGPGDVPGD